MEIQALEKVGLKSKYRVDITKDELSALKEDKIKKIAEKVKIQGFRQGKAPLSLIEAQHRGTIMNDILEEATNKAIERVYNDNKLVTVGSPDVDIKEFDMDSGVCLEVVFELFPEIEDIDMASIFLEKSVVDVSEREINSSLEQIASYYKSFEDVLEDRETILGDVLVIDFSGSVDGVEFDGGKGNDFPLELGSNMFIPGFEEQLVSKRLNDVVEVNVKFPEDYYAEHLKGKDALFSVTIKKLQKVSKEINDELAKRSGFNTLDELKEDIKKKYQAHIEQLERGNLKNKLMDKLLETRDFEIPDSLLNKEKEMLWNHFVHMREHMKSHEEKGDYETHGHSAEEIESYKGTDEDIKKEQDIKAREKIKLGLILSDISTKNDIRIKEQDIHDFIDKESKRHGSNINEMISFYKSNKKALQQLESRVMEDKIVDFMLSKVSYNEKVTQFDEYTIEYFKKITGVLGSESYSKNIFKYSCDFVD